MLEELIPEAFKAITPKSEHWAFVGFVVMMILDVALG